MTEQLDRLGIPFERFDAIDAKTADPEVLSAPFAARGPLGVLSPGDMACTYSHLVLWRKIAASEDRYTAILEDDIFMTPDAPRFLLSEDWIPEDAGLVKLERYGPKSQLIVIGKPRMSVNGRILAPLLSRHTGSGGYIISRELAARLANYPEKFTLPIDHLLFNPNNSPAFDWLKPWQLVPAVVDQQEAIGGGTDIRSSRDATQPRGLAGLRRRLMRNYYDLRLVPRQIAQVLFGFAKIVEIRLA